jgi:hypothetical protein
MAVYTVTIKVPEVNEEVVVNADSPEQAQERAVHSAMNRLVQSADVTVVEQENP